MVVATNARKYIRPGANVDIETRFVPRPSPEDRFFRASLRNGDGPASITICAAIVPARNVCQDPIVCSSVTRRARQNTGIDRYSKGPSLGRRSHATRFFSQSPLSLEECPGPRFVISVRLFRSPLTGLHFNRACNSLCSFTTNNFLIEGSSY